MFDMNNRPTNPEESEQWAKDYRSSLEEASLSFFKELGHEPVINGADGQPYISAEVFAFLASVLNQKATMEAMAFMITGRPEAKAASDLLAQVMTMVDVFWCLAHGREVNPSNA